MTKRRSLVQFATYAMVGAVGTLAQYAILVVSVSMHWLTPVVASVIGALIGGMINYVLNARITFRSHAHSSALPKFALTAVFGAAMNGVLMKILIDFFGIYYLLAQVIATALVLMLTYTINLMWTFRRQSTGTGMKS